jgi:hypothetical protein
MMHPGCTLKFPSTRVQGAKGARGMYLSIDLKRKKNKGGGVDTYINTHTTLKWLHPCTLALKYLTLNKFGRVQPDFCLHPPLHP